MIILLNGPSSSGKTSIARALQSAWDTPLVYLALDTIIGMLPFAYTGTGPRAQEGFHLFEHSEEGETLTGYRMGALGRQLNQKLAGLTADIARDGLDVVVDHVLIDVESIRPFLTALPLQDSYLVGVNCELDELRRREQSRGDRMLGLARFQHIRVHWMRDYYDLEVDSFDGSPDVLASAIIARVHSAKPAGLGAFRGGEEPTSPEISR